MDYDLIISNGTIGTASDVFCCDIGVRDGTIAALGRDLGEAAKTIDASGMLVLPVGIDSRVHLAPPSGDGIVMADDFASVSLSATFRGNTTVMPFCLQRRGTSVRETIKAYHGLAGGNCYTDVALHLAISDPTDQVLGQELPALAEGGYTSFKVLMTYEDVALNNREMLEVMSVACETGALVMVHAENFDAIRFLTGRLERGGPIAPKFHGTSRPIPVECEATHRAISLGELVDVPVMIVHGSNREAIDEIARARSRSRKDYGETCSQYLVLTEKDIDGLNIEGTRYVCPPPPRDHASQIACWEGLETGIVSVFSSHHYPFRYESPQGKLNPKSCTSFRWVPNGIPGIETRLPILFSEGVGNGRITLQQFVAFSATNHARTYGLTRKSSIAIGMDADIAIWDPHRKLTISQSLLHHGSDFTPYEGIEVTGWPVTTTLRGQIIVKYNRLVGHSEQGMHIARDRSSLAAPAGRLPTGSAPAKAFPAEYRA